MVTVTLMIHYESNIMSKMLGMLCCRRALILLQVQRQGNLSIVFVIACMSSWQSSKTNNECTAILLYGFVTVRRSAS